jgi:hypothetical protein
MTPQEMIERDIRGLKDSISLASHEFATPIEPLRKKEILDFIGWCLGELSKLRDRVEKSN